MANISDTFSGYMDIDDDTFVYNVTDRIVTLLPAYSDRVKQMEAWNRIRLRDTNQSEYLIGTDGVTKVAFMRSGPFYFEQLGLNPAIRFAAPILIKAAGNANGFFDSLTDEWTKFHAITFYGGNINSVFSPEFALQSGVWEKTEGIKFRPQTDYTHSVNINLDNNKITLTVSVYESWSRRCTGRRGAHSLGELDSLIRLSFEEAQCFNSIPEYYQIIKKLVSILTRKRNISFDTYLSQNGKDGNLYQTAVCKIFDNYENYAEINSFESIPIFKIFDCLPNLIKKIHNKEAEPLLELLPLDNKNVNKVSIANIQDMCTALEAAYPNEKREKDALIEELKKDIKNAINSFQQRHDNIDIQKQTTLSSCFQYLDFTLRQKILTMYSDNKNIIDIVISKYHLPQIDEESVGEFVKLRNSKSHRGIFDFGDCVQIYTALFALVYVQLFRNMGITNDMIVSIIHQFF